MNRVRYRPWPWISVLLACLPPPTPAAQVYRWVDEQGVSHFSQIRPAGRAAETVRLSPATPPVEPQEAMQRVREAEKAFQERRKAAEDRRRQAAAEAARKSTMAQNCENARARLALFGSGVRLRLTGPDGGRSYGTDADREARVQQAREEVEKYCAGP